MATNPVCPIHNLEAVVKTGLPKKNKRTGEVIGTWPPFFGCPWNGNDPTTGRRAFCNHRFTVVPDPVQSFDQSLTQMTKDTARETAEDKKGKDIRWMNALNNAALLIANRITPVTGEWQTFVRDTADVIYAMPRPELRGEQERPNETPIQEIDF